MGRARIAPSLRARAAAVGCGALVVIALAGCGQDVSHEEAEKADQLDTALAPLDVPEGVAASMYGTDGGAVCAEAEQPDGLASEAASAVSHRFTLRKTEADPDRVAYVRAVIETYCPDELKAYEAYVDGLAVDGSGS